jgi:hypothetical protein
MDKTIYAICEALQFEKSMFRFNIFNIKQQYDVRDEDFEDIFMDSYENFLKQNVQKNGANLFLTIFKRKLLKFKKGFDYKSGEKRRDSLYSQFNDEDYVFEDTIENSYFNNELPEDFNEIIENKHEEIFGKSDKSFEEKMIELEDYYKLY